MVNCKGTVFMSAQMYATQHLDDPGAERAMEALSSADQEALASVLAVGWYPADAIYRFHAAIDQVHGSGNLDICFSIGRFAAEWELNTFHKLLLRFKSPFWLVTRGTRMWSQYYDAGQWDINEPGEERMSGALHEFNLGELAFCARMRGFFTRAVELTGGKGVQVKESSCINRGNRHCAFEVAWGSATADRAIANAR